LAYTVADPKSALSVPRDSMDMTKALGICRNFLIIYSHEIAVSLQDKDIDSAREKLLKPYGLSSEGPKQYAYGNATAHPKPASFKARLELYAKAFLMALTKLRFDDPQHSGENDFERLHKVVKEGYHTHALKWLGMLLLCQIRSHQHV
jgi:hypothetical protein